MTSQCFQLCNIPSDFRPYLHHSVIIRNWCSESLKVFQNSFQFQFFETLRIHGNGEKQFLDAVCLRSVIELQSKQHKVYVYHLLI